MKTGSMPAFARSINLMLVMLLIAGAQLSALQYKTASNVYITGDYQEDLFLWGATVNFDGNIVGDVICGANAVTINGTTDGNVIAVARRVTINGEICRSLRCFAQTVNISSQVDGDVVAVGADVTLGNDAVVGRDLAAFAGEVFLDGTIRGKAYIDGGTVTIAGLIDGDVTIKADNISVTPDAVINGELNYTSKNKGNISPEAQIVGGAKWKKKSTETSESSSAVPYPTSWFWSLMFLGGALVLGILAILIKRDGVVAVVEEIRSNAALDGLIGVGVMVVVPILLILVGITLVGIPIAAAGFTVYVFAFLIARVLVGITIGYLLLGLLKKGRISLGWALVVGMIILAIGYKIPYVGWLIYLLAWAVGAGALTMLLFRKKAKPVAP
jgi:cytoskeletal protein CcmA (bactofilin family)